MIPAISIDNDSCCGCGRCASICIRDSISVENGKAAYNGTSCFSCYQCFAVCPRHAISITRDPGFEGIPVRDLTPSGNEALTDLLKVRRSVRWFTDGKVTRAEFERLFDAARYSPTSMHRQDVEFAVVDERLDDFMQMVYEVLKPLEDTLPRIHEFCLYHEGRLEKPKGHPLLWGGRQIILAFSEVPADSLIAAARVEMAGYTMGLAGFYSLFLIMAAERDPSRFSRFFGIDPRKKPSCAYIIGHPKVRYERTLPPRKISINYC